MSHLYHSMGTCATQLTCLRKFVGMVEGGNERIQYIELEVNQISNKPILIICVYMPTSGGSEKTIEYPLRNSRFVE